MSQQQIESNKRQPRRLPFHPRRSSRKARLELAADATTLSDVLELTTSPILDRAGEEPVRARYDPVVRREVPMTPGRGLALAERPPPPPGPKPFEELVGIAWPHEVKQAARSLNPRRRRVRVVWSGGIRYKLKAGQGQIRAFKECQKNR
ncbi:hypothetical protein ACLKA6_015892 [Drosophila palustris]